MKLVSHKDGTVYGVVVEERNVFVKWKWKEFNIDRKVPRICAQESTTEHEMTPEFWDSFKEVTAAEWNELWIQDSNSIKYQSPKKYKQE